MICGDLIYMDLDVGFSGRRKSFFFLEARDAEIRGNEVYLEGFLGL